MITNSAKTVILICQQFNNIGRVHILSQNETYDMVIILKLKLIFELHVTMNDILHTHTYKYIIL